MTELSAPFAPDWILPPGDTILDLTEERGWTQIELARRLGYTEKHVSQLINGKAPVTVDAAQRLERVLGSTTGFWLALEANYQKHKKRLEAAAEPVSWLAELPVRELMACGAIAKQKMYAKHKPGVVEACLRFFGVASPDEWRSHYGEMQVAFRRSRAEQSDVGAISAWLRLGEQQAEKLDGPAYPAYNKGYFESVLHAIRPLTCEPPEVFEPKMRAMLRDAGVLLVLVPAIPGAHVSGVARWLGSARPLIQLSLYGKTNDKFWFTFFHEAAHILLHANSREDRKSIFLDDPNASHTNDLREREANDWAGDCLIPKQAAARLSSLRSKDAVVNFAKQIGVHPGIVVGRLQHDGLIPPSWMNNLKQRFQFKNTS